MKGPTKRITEMKWSDPRDGRRWLVRTYWSGDVGLGTGQGFEPPESEEKSEARIIFLYPADLAKVGEALITKNRREKTAGELSEKELMDLLDQARKEKR